jgi:cell division protein FtsB
MNRIPSFPKWFKLGLFLVGAAYLSFHTLHGERGLYAWFSQTRQTTILEKQLAEATTEREALENRINALRPAQLDADLLNERVRYMHSMAEPDEVVILYPKPLW